MKINLESRTQTHFQLPFYSRRVGLGMRLTKSVTDNSTCCGEKKQHKTMFTIIHSVIKKYILKKRKTITLESSVHTYSNC